MNLTKKHLTISSLSVFILLSLLFILGETSLKSPIRELSQYIPSTSTQLAAISGAGSGLIAHYTFDDTTKDSAGSNNGTVSGGATYAEGKIGRAISLDGVDDGVTINSVLIDQNTVTVCAWVKPVTFGVNSHGGIVGTVATRFFISSGRWGVTSDSGGSAARSSSPVITGVWQHVCGIRLSSGLASIYVNGTLDGVANQNSGTPGTFAINMKIGSRGDGADNFNGLIDDVRIYNRELSTTEITDLYNYTGSTIIQPNSISPILPSPDITLSPVIEVTPPIIPIIPTSDHIQTSGSRIFYIDWTKGSNSNDGLSKSSPWKCHPYMKGLGCGTMPTYTHHAGDKFIFKGGITWPTTAMNLVINTAGTQGNSDYYGVDETWFAGGSFTKPIFDGEKIYTNSLVSVRAGHVIIDGLEIKGMIISDTNNFGRGTISLDRAPDVLINKVHVHGFDLKKVNISSIQRKNMYAYITTSAPHGYIAGQPISVAEVSDGSFNGAGAVAESWSRNAVVDSENLDANHFRYANTGPDTGIMNGGWTSLVYVNSAMGGIIGNYNPQYPDVIVQNSEIDNLGGPMAGDALRMIYVVRNNIVHDIASFVLMGNTVHDNIVYNIDYPKQVFDPDSHTNLLWLSGNGENTPMPDGSISSAFNNLMYDVNPAESIFVLPGYGGGTGTHTEYVYNNVMMSRGIHNLSINNSNVPANGLITNAYVWNNTFVNLGTNQSCIRVGSRTNNSPEICGSLGCGNITNVVVQNNQCILSNVGFENNGGYDFLTYDHNVTQKIAEATIQGQVFSNKYSPTISSNGIVNTGVNIVSGIFSRDFLGTPRPQGSAWDIGAYEYTGGGVVQPVNPPVTPPTPADFNHDGRVNATDLLILTSHWNQNNPTYDLNADGIVNSLDYVVMIKSWRW